MKKCPRCGAKKFWHLATGQLLCSHCGLTKGAAPTLSQATRLAPYWKGRLVEFFCLGVPAYRLRFQVPLNQKTVQRWYRILREAIYQQQMKALSALSGEIEMGEEFVLDDITYTALEVTHSPGTFGLLAKTNHGRAAYIPDTGPLPPATLEAIRGIETLILGPLSGEGTGCPKTTSQ